MLIQPSFSYELKIPWTRRGVNEHPKRIKGVNIYIGYITYTVETKKWTLSVRLNFIAQMADIPYWGASTPSRSRLKSLHHIFRRGKKTKHQRGSTTRCCKIIEWHVSLKHQMKK